MKTKKIILFVIFLSTNCCFSKDSQLDSLKSVLSSYKEDTIKVKAILDLSKLYYNTNPIIAINLAYQAKTLSVRLKFQKGVALALKSIGIANYNQGKFIDSKECWQEALIIFDTIGDKIGVSNMYSNLGAIYQIQGNDALAVESHLKSLKIAESINDTLRIITALVNLGAVYYNKPQNYDKALEIYLKVLPLSEAIGDSEAIGVTTVNIGELYFKKSDFSKALDYFKRSYNAYGENSESAPYSLNDIGMVYCKLGDFHQAINYHTLAYAKAKKLNAKMDLSISLKMLAVAYQKKGDLSIAIYHYKLAMSLAKEVYANNELKEIYEGLADLYDMKRDYNNAFKYQKLLIVIRDTLYNAETNDKIKTLFFNFEIEKRLEEKLLANEKLKHAAKMQEQVMIRNRLAGGLAIVLIFSGVLFIQRNKIKKGKKLSDELLLNILPAETAEELKLTGAAEAKSYDLVTVIFTDFKNFTQVAENMTPKELVKEINHCYSAFDNIISKYGIEKIKTLGDGYMCAGGLPVKNVSNPTDAIQAATEIQTFMERLKNEKSAEGKLFFETRIGIHTGPVVAGIVGIKKFAYDIWGDTVNIAARMESSGEAGKINISGSTFELIKDKYQCTNRGKVDAKNKGLVDMYFVEQALPKDNFVEQV